MRTTGVDMLRGVAYHPARNVLIWVPASLEKNLTSGSESFCSFSTTGNTVDLTVLGEGVEELIQNISIMYS